MGISGGEPSFEKGLDQEADPDAGIKKLKRLGFGEASLMDSLGRIDDAYNRRLRAMDPGTFVQIGEGDIIARPPMSNDFLIFYADGRQAPVAAMVEEGYQPATDEVKGRIEAVIRDARSQGIDFAMDTEWVEADSEEGGDGEIIDATWVPVDEERPDSSS